MPLPIRVMEPFLGSVGGTFASTYFSALRASRLSTSKGRTAMSTFAYMCVHRGSVTARCYTCLFKELSILLILVRNGTGTSEIKQISTVNSHFFYIRILDGGVVELELKTDLARDLRGPWIDERGVL